MKKAKTNIKRLHIDLNGFMSDFEEMEYKENVEAINRFVEKGGMFRQHSLFL